MFFFRWCPLEGAREQRRLPREAPESATRGVREFHLGRQRAPLGRAKEHGGATWGAREQGWGHLGRQRAWSGATRGAREWRS